MARASAREPSGYSGTPLPKKLGIKPDTVVALLGAPGAFEKVLGELPAGVTLRRDLKRTPGTTIFFVADRAAYERRLGDVASVLAAGSGVWIAWRKQRPGLVSDLNENGVRDLALARGLVDIKVCAIDATWSGLRLALRRSR